MKHQVVKAASRFAVIGLALLALAISCAVDLVLDLVLGRGPALFVAGGLFVILALAWGVLPLTLRWADDRERAAEDESGGTRGDTGEGSEAGEH